MDYVLIIVSHRRARICFDKTYSLLQRTGAIKPIIWLNDEQDLKDYKEIFPPDTEFRVGGSSLTEKRNLIVNSFPLDTNIVSADDDISEIYVLKEKGKKVVLKDFNKLVALGFSYCKSEQSSFWGLYPLDNPLCMNPFVRRNLSYCIGALFGMVNKKITVELDCAEDFERTLKFWELEKKVLRLDFVGISTKYYTTSGGLQTIRTEEKNYSDKKTLVDRYSGVSKMTTKRNRAEIKLLGKKDVIEILVPEL
jgi:hypothetical protein